VRTVVAQNPSLLATGRGLSQGRAYLCLPVAKAHLKLHYALGSLIRTKSVIGGDAVGTRAFRVALIKPSHYDADGYVIQWRRSYIPSNSLASVYGLVAECSRQAVLGGDVDIEIEACDECNTVVDVRAVAKRIRAAGGGMVGLVGVQSNQFPRALDLGRQFRAFGIPVVVGGFHVSGCLAMLPTLPADIQKALDFGIHVFAGEAEGHMADILRDITRELPSPSTIT
jgi:hypothetical protein